MTVFLCILLQDEEETDCIGVEVDGECYILFGDETLVYDDAAEKCAADGGHLAYVKTEKAYIAILDYLSHLTDGNHFIYVWLGASYDVSILCNL